ncbi:Protein timeless-like [Papilio machaon]|uniref:Protein timeless-like n=1 Tax=Papilio machaon TaxID=76193 RepID=A0A0N1PH15_PAPMA|nr:Protein timeless-like [Papilio machaon]
MSSLLSAELSATCNALGTLNKKTGKYMIDDFTLNTVKDLIRYLRRDGEDHEIRRHFGQTKVLQTDLLPMLIDHWEYSELFDVTLRLIVNLTNPALLLYREEVPVERTARHNYLQILSHLQNYKEEAFTKVDVWQMFSKKLAKVLEIDWSERDEDTGLIIERILILIRNVLHVPADLDKERRPENDASVHDQTRKEDLRMMPVYMIRLFLKEFCIEFLNSSYNPLMHYVKDVLVRSRAQQNDESYYLWAVKFFMEFNRGKKHQAQKVKHVPVEVPAWDVLCPQIACVLSAGINEYPPPFDAASDVPIDQQKEDCMKKIQKLMRESKFEDAIGTFRAAREVWPEEGIFGVSGIPEDEELEMLQTIYNTDLGVEVNEVPEVEDESQDGYDNEEEDEEDEANATSVVETDFDFQDFVQRFCHPRVVSACAYLLERYEKNSSYTNHCIIKMLHRIAWDCKRPSMMFQASMFLTFQKIFHNPLPHFKELEKFGLFVFRKFSEVALKNTKVFIELLFWKSSKDAIDIEHGYDLYSDQKDKVSKGHWSEEQEDELRNLFMENQTNPTTEKDVIDWILDNLIDQTRTRRGVIKKLKELGLIFKAPTKRSTKERFKEKVPKEFSEEEDSLLIELWKQYGDSPDPMGVIIPRMPRKRPKRSFVERLLELDLIQDKRQCRKKKQRKSKSDGNNSDRSDSSSTSSESSDESDSDNNIKVRSPKVKKNIQKIDKRKIDASRNRKANKTIELSANEIAKLLVQAVDNGFGEALKWVAENLEEVALDQEAEGYDPSAEGTPLVPISDDSVQAMENQMFHKVLKGIGLLPPADEQETYWRIPSHLHFDTIRKRREIILKAINKELIINDEEITKNIISEESEKNEKEESSDDEDLFDSLRKLRDNNAEEYVNKSMNKTNTRKRSRSSDDEDNGKEKLQRIEEEQIEEKSDEEDILSFAKKTLQCEDEPDTEDILKSIPKHNSEDSENEDEEIVVTKRKKARLIIEDDSD